MTIASVMVYVDPAQQAEEQVRVARSIAAKFEASVIGISAFAVEPDFVSEGVIIAETTPEDLKRTKTALAEKEKWFRDIVGFPKGKVEWRWGIEQPTVFLANEARAADLVVIKNKREKVDPYHLIDPAGAVLRMGRPTILVPDHMHELQADRVVVGWKDTREARHAVHDALPLLRKASQVTIIEICASDEQDLARRHVRDVAKYLQGHSVKCEIDVRVHMAASDARHLSPKGSRNFETGDRHRMAPRRVQIVLALEVEAPWRQACQSAVGSATDPRRVAQARHSAHLQRFH